MLIEKGLDPGQSSDEGIRKLGKRHVAYHDQKADTVLEDRLALVDLVADALIMSDRDAAIAAAILEPLLVRTIRRKQVMVPLNL